jgi:ABC-type glutathione transport system ATPase component
MAFLEARDIVLTYGSEAGPVRAVDGVSFEIHEPGQCLAVIGETGSGKTSLLYALTRVLPRSVTESSGTVVLGGDEISSYSLDRYRREVRWRRISVVFQASMNGFNPVKRVGTQIIERAALENGARESDLEGQARQLLRSVGLGEDVYRRFPHELSGGMKQRAALAMALMMDPELVILDEPTSALDVSVQAQIMNTLKELKWSRRVGMIFITHDIALASDLADTMLVMKSGVQREFGSAEEVLTRPRDSYTRKLLESVPRLRGGV